MAKSKSKAKELNPVDNVKGDRVMKLPNGLIVKDNTPLKKEE